nr:MAG TPA: hypothetical protein [Herelleviridae sp.]
MNKQTVRNESACLPFFFLDVSNHGATILLLLTWL